VIITGRSQESVDKAVNQLKKDGYSNAFGQPCHFGRVKQVQQLKAWISEKFGKLDVLINNAATSLHFGPILETTPKAYDKMMDLNVKVTP
jgi:NAD(P)-dependent dehydrogenase (short-subunit alcohol dehydrogenase family)